MGNTGCSRACDCSRHSVDFVPPLRPQRSQEGYAGPEFGVDGVPVDVLLPQEAAVACCGSRSREIHSGAEGTSAGDGVGRGTGSAAEGPNPLGTSDSFWTSYFGREDKELLSLASPLGETTKRRRRHSFQSKAVYEGEWEGTQRSGFGVQTWPDGAVYEGEWRQNKANGGGRFTHCDGDVFVGQWRNNMAHGLGRYLHSDGTIYEGGFQDDLQDGHGVEIWTDSSLFKGTFFRGQKSGHGIYVWSDGSMYEGTWEGNQIDGHGVYVGHDSRQFRGRWRETHMHGFGHYTWPDGRSYKGQYREDTKDGLGTFVWADGRHYEGFWRNGVQHGVGRLCHNNKQEGNSRQHPEEERIAEWEHGERVRWLDADR